MKKKIDALVEKSNILKPIFKKIKKKLNERREALVKKYIIFFVSYKIFFGLFLNVPLSFF